VRLQLQVLFFIHPFFLSTLLSVFLSNDSALSKTPFLLEGWDVFSMKSTSCRGKRCWRATRRGRRSSEITNDHLWKKCLYYQTHDWARSDEGALAPSCHEPQGHDQTRMLVYFWCFPKSQVVLFPTCDINDLFVGGVKLDLRRRRSDSSKKISGSLKKENNGWDNVRNWRETAGEKMHRYVSGEIQI